jgi:hypothetical protein
MQVRLTAFHNLMTTEKRWERLAQLALILLSIFYSIIVTGIVIK